MAVKKPPLEIIFDRYNYNENTGEIIVARKYHSNVIVGRKMGSKNRGGYLKIGITFDGSHYNILAHRMAWALHNKQWPPDEKMIDHIDNNKTNNSINNLRLCDRSQNQMNRLPTRREMPKGVTRIVYKSKIAYTAKIKDSKKSRYLGTFSNKTEAAKAYQKAALEAFGEFAKF